MLVYQYIKLLTGLQSVTDDTVQLLSSSSRSRVEKNNTQDRPFIQHDRIEFRVLLIPQGLHGSS
jgi:hypothetical protein